MRIPFSSKITGLARCLQKPLYAVGGVVRNFLIDGSISQDVDLTAVLSPADLLPKLLECGFTVKEVIDATGTVIFFEGDKRYEYTCFRQDEYDLEGTHKPLKTTFIKEVEKDCLRRDFTVNAVYYDIAKAEILDFCGGVNDIKNKVLQTVREPDITFREDALRILRLARFTAELGFTPTKATVKSALKYADGIRNLSGERVYGELKRILYADGKYPFSPCDGHYRGLKLLVETNALSFVLPDLMLGKDMAQRTDFHKYDVLEHSLRCALYADKSVRLSALLHDIGKPYCKLNFGKYSGHAKQGAIIAKALLQKFGENKSVIKEVCFLIENHMFDLQAQESECAVKFFMAQNFSYIDKLISVKQTDYRASLEDNKISPSVKKWQKIYKDLVESGAPLSLKQLAVNGNDLKDAGYQGKNVKAELNRLFEIAVNDPVKNKKEILLKISTVDKEKGND